MEQGELLEAMADFLSRFAGLAVGLTIACIGFSTVLSIEDPVLRLAVRHRPGKAARILRRAHRAYSRRPRAALAIDVARVAVVSSLACWLTVSALVYALPNPLVAYLALVIGPIGFIRAYWWLGGRESRIGFLPPPIPRTAGWTIPSKRRETAIRLYQVRLHQHLMLVALGGATLAYVGIPDADVGAVESIMLIAPAILALCVVELMTVLIRRLDGRLHALALIAAALKPRPTGKPQPDLTVEQSRGQIAMIAVTTERYAHHLHDKQNRHPIAHLLGLEVALLRAYLATFDSLTLEHPAEITRSLRRITAILVGGKGEFLRATQAQLEHLTDDVTPPPTHRAWTARLSDAVDLTDRTSKVVGLLISLGVLVVLAQANKASIQDLAPWLP